MTQMNFQKKEMLRRRRFTNFEKICIKGLGFIPTSWKRISLSPACNHCKNLIVYNFYHFQLFFSFID